MKKTFLALAICFSLSSAMAEGDKTIMVQKEKPLISNGLYLNLGLGFPSLVGNLNTSGSFSLGTQFNLEIGNQWYFVKNDKFGLGFKVSWLQLGYSGYKLAIGRTHVGDFKFFKFGPQFSVGIANNMALDVAFDISPTTLFSANTPADMAYLTYGVLFGPNVRVRINRFAVGGELSFGSLTQRDLSDTRNPNGLTNKVNFLYPRLYIGFSF